MVRFRAVQPLTDVIQHGHRFYEVKDKGICNVRRANMENAGFFPGDGV